MRPASPDLVVLAVAKHLRERGYRPHMVGQDIRAAAEAAEALVIALGVNCGDPDVGLDQSSECR